MRVGIINRVPLIRAPFNEWTPTGANVTLISRYPLTAEDKSHFKQVIVFDDYDDDLKLTEMISRLHQEEPFDRLITLSEFDILRVSKIRNLLQISGQDYFSGTLFRDKITMKQFAINQKLHVPQFTRVQNIVDVRAFVDRYGFPVILKPSNQAGSKDVHVLNSMAEVTSKNTEVLLATYGEMDLEQFIQGDLYHIDGIINHGQLMFVSVAKYLNDLGYSTTLNQSASTFADFTVSESTPTFNTLKNAAKQLLSPAHLECGTVHLEFILDKYQQPYFVEMGSRTGGLMITNTIKRKYGLIMNEASYKLQANFKYKLHPQVPVTESGYLTVLPKKGQLIKFDTGPLRSLVQDLQTNFEIGKRYNEAAESTDYIAIMRFDAPDDTAMQKKIEQLNKLIVQNTTWIQ